MSVDLLNYRRWSVTYMLHVPISPYNLINPHTMHDILTESQAIQWPLLHLCLYVQYVLCNNVCSIILLVS